MFSSGPHRYALATIPALTVLQLTSPTAAGALILGISAAHTLRELLDRRKP
ncbi:hypothetical protein OG298_45125 (plasmid) [Streptomyces sp. NBC_01005]|uniref:hypothetical protein n=1 Tax=Streptomyces sp. NBC_01005 TaxID=2903715 RepID=UPI003862EE7D|nr:hypothetical protein OG298_45125 [Streptomyces sp. NBC_01005]